LNLNFKYMEVLEKKAKTLALLGNEAIVRGALESGVQYVSTYPGTPSSEIGVIFSQIAKTVGVYFEFSTNEKVALESSIGANFSDLKTLVAMKSFGLNVALDSLFPLAYTGTKAGMVIIVADDPSCWSSAQSEENVRGFAELLKIPILEPSDPQECKDFVKLGFEISEKFRTPVIIRTTTRVAHQSALVKIDNLVLPLSQFKGKFVKDPRRFVTMPPRVLEMKAELLQKVEKIKKYAENLKINFIENRKTGAKIGIITSAISYLHTKEGLKELNIKVPILKLGFFYPLSEEKVKKFIKGLKKVLIIEELEPYLEKEINRLAKDVNPKLQVFGKNLLSEIGELRPEFVTAAIAKVIGKKYPEGKLSASCGASKLKTTAYRLETKHIARFCPGCPYWSVFATIKKSAPEGTIFGGDIGCYMLAGQPPHNMQDYLFSMGSGFGIAHGIEKATSISGNKDSPNKQKVIAFIGDSTFFHAGIPALINTVFNKSNPLFIILDNQTTAMTGHQPHPGVGKTGMGEETLPVKIEDIVQACGVNNLKIVDPVNVQELENAVKEFLPKEEVSVIIARRMCALLAKKQRT